jgi:hypothetical protein
MKEIDEQIKKLEEQLANAQKELEKLKKIREEEIKIKLFDGIPKEKQEEIFSTIEKNARKFSKYANFGMRELREFENDGIYLGHTHISLTCPWKIVLDSGGAYVLVVNKD